MTTAIVGHPQHRHFAQVDGDGLGHMALLGADAGVGARGVDEGDDGQAEFVRHFHQAQRLPVALGMRHAEVARDFLLGLAALLLGEQHDRLALEERRAADERLVVVKLPVAVQLLKALEEGVDVVERVGPLGMAGDLHPLPRRQAGIDFLFRRLDLLFEGGNLAGKVEMVLEGLLVKLLKMLLEFAQRLLEFQRIGGFCHAPRLRRGRKRCQPARQPGNGQTVALSSRGPAFSRDKVSDPWLGMARFVTGHRGLHRNDYLPRTLPAAAAIAGRGRPDQRQKKDDQRGRPFFNSSVGRSF